MIESNSLETTNVNPFGDVYVRGRSSRDETWVTLIRTVPWPTSVSFPLFNWNTRYHEQWRVSYLSALMVSLNHNIFQCCLFEEAGRMSKHIKQEKRWKPHHTSHHNACYIMLNQHTSWNKKPFSPWASCISHKIIYSLRISIRYLINSHALVHGRSLIQRYPSWIVKPLILTLSKPCW